MGNKVYNHDSDTLSGAIGLSVDQIEEIEFKANQIAKRNLSRSKTLEASHNWIESKFDEADRNLACLIMGQAVSDAIRIQSMSAGFMDKLKNIHKLKEIIEHDSTTIAFTDPNSIEDFTKEFKELVTKYNGEVHLMGGDDTNLMAVRFKDDAGKDDFHKELKALETKYGVNRGGEQKVPMPFNGPIAEA